MFEAVFARMLNALLGEFVEDIGGVDNKTSLHEKIQLGVWSGYICLEHLVLKDKLLQMLGLPLQLAYGAIGRLELRIPWGNLGGEPVVVIIDRINILLQPKYEWDPKALDNREQTIKQAKLVAAELFANRRLDDGETNKGLPGIKNFAKRWLMDSIINKLVENIQITVRDVHVRYEDHISCPSDFCVGITLESLHAQSREGNLPFNIDVSYKHDSKSTDEELKRLRGKDVEIDESNCIRKMVQVDHLSVYWNPLIQSSMDACTSTFLGRSSQEIEILMMRIIAKRNHQFIDRLKHHYILFPVDMRTDIDARFDPITGKTEMRATINIANISVEFEDRQFREIVSLVSNMKSFDKLGKFSKYRPLRSMADSINDVKEYLETLRQAGSISSLKHDVRNEKITTLLPEILRLIEAGDAILENLYMNLRSTSRAWLQYSVNAAVYQMRTERRKFTGKELNRRIQDKYVYVELWKRKLEMKSSATKKSNSEPTSAKIDDNKNIFSEQDPYEHIRSGELYQTVLSIARRKKFEKSSIQNSNRKAIKEPYSLAEGMELLVDLEHILSFEDIVVFRSIAENDFSQLQTTNGWLGGILAWATGAEESEEERRKLFEALKYDPELVLRGSSNYNQDPEEAVATIVVLLEKGSIRLALSSPSVTSSFSLPFLIFRLTSLNMKTNILNVGTSLEVKLDNIEAFEMMSSEASDTQTSHFLMERDMESNMVYNQLIKRRLPTENDMKFYKSGRSPISPGAEQSALFEAFVQLMPPSTKELEVVVELELRELIIMVSPAAHWVKSISSFFKFPDDLLFWSELEMTTMNQIADLKSRVDAKLEYMISTHANLKLEADIKAPVIVIAESGVMTDGSEMLVIDLGNINLTTEKLAKAMLEKSMIDESVSNAGDRSDATPNRQSNNDVTPSRAINYKEKVARPKEAFANDERRSSRTNDSLILETDKEKPDTPVVSEIQKIGSTDANEVGENISTNVQSRVRSNTNGASTINGGMDFDGGVHESLFDIFQVIIKDIEVYMTTNVSSIFATDIFFDEDEFLKRVPIVDKFDISMEIQVSTLPWDITIPPVKLYVEFPEINVRLSDHKLVRLARFSNKLLHSSKSIIDQHRTKVDKLIAAMNQRSSIIKIDNDINLTDFLNEDDEEYEFYDAETDKRSASNDRLSSDGKTTNSKASGIERKRYHGRPRGASNLSDHSSHTHNSSSSNSKAFSARGSTTSSQFLDAKSLRTLKYNERNSLNSSFIEDNENDDDMSTCSEDSFLSAEEEHPKDTAKRIESLHFAMKQRENMRKKLMSEMRIIEGGTSSKAQALYNSLQDELNNCEKELHQLKLEYLELRMLADGPKAPVSNTTNETSDLHGLFDALMLPVKSQEDLVRRRKIMRTNIFKSRPQVVQRRRKELIFLQINLSVMNIILSKHNPESIPPSTIIQADPFGTDILKLRLAGVSLKVKHWNTDTKLTLVMRELDIQDAMETARRYNDNHSIVFLMSSEPSASGICLSQDRYVSTDLVRLRYDVSYGHEITNNNSKILVNDRHQVRLTFGFLGFNIAQETLLALCQIGEALKEAIVIEKKEEEDNVQVKSVGFSADAAISIKCKGFYFSLLQNNKPSLSLSVWSLNALSQINQCTAVINFSIADVTMHHFVETNVVGRDNKVYQKKLIFGRKAENLPTITIASKINVVDGFALVQDMTIRLTAMRILLVPSCVSSILAQLYDGALAKHLRTVGTPPQHNPTYKKSTNVLDTLLSPILSLCSGQVDIALGEIDLSFPSDYDGQPLSFNFGLQDILCKLRWGNVCVHGGLELLLMVNGIKANIAQLAILNPFNISCMLSTKSKQSILVNDDAASLQALFNSFPPKVIAKVCDNELHISASLSPIVFNVSERLIHTFGSWTKENILYFESISKILSSQTSEVFEDIPSNDDVLSSFDSIGFKLKTSILLYEIAVALNADTPSSSGGKDKNQSKQFSGYEFTSPLFYLSLRHFLISSALHNEDNPEIDERFLIQLDSMPRAFINITLKSLDFEYKRAGANALKRLICTATEEKSIRFNTENTDADNDLNDISDVMNAVDIKCEISPEWAIDLHATISNVQITVLSEAVITLATVGTLYKNAAISSFLKTALTDSIAEGKLKKKILNDEFAKILLRESAHAHPSSVPLSMAATTMISNDEEKSKDPKKSIILSKRSFFLPSPLRLFNVNFSLQSCGIWMSSDDDNAHALAVYLTSDIEFSSAFHPIEWQEFSQENDTQCFWTSRINLTSGQVYLSRVRHLQIFKKLASMLNDDGISSGGGNDNTGILPPQPIKSIVMPFSAQLLQSLFVIKNNNSNELNFIENGSLNIDVAQKVEIYIQEMEVLGFLDFRTFLQIFKNAIKPLIDIASTANTESKGTGTSFNDPLNDSSSSLADTMSSELKIIVPKSVVELFVILGEISRTSIQVAHDGLSVFIINDLYRQPVTIARIVCSVIKINTALIPTDRRIGIIRRNGSIEFNVEDSDDRSHQSASTRIDRVFNSTIDGEQVAKSSLPVLNFLNLNSCASVCVEYHNQNLMAWEPLLEPLDWNVDFELPMICNSLDEPIFWNLEGVNTDSVDLVRNNNSDDIGNNGLKFDRSAKLKANLRDININVTVALLESLRSTIKSLSKLSLENVDRIRPKLKEKISDDTDAADLSMMIIRNDSGLMMKYWCSDVSRATDVPPNTEKPLHMDTDAGSGSSMKERSFDPLSTSRSVSLSLQRPGSDPWPTLRDVPLDGTGCRLFLLEVGDDDGFSHTPKKNKIGRVLRSPSYPMLASNNSVCIAAELLSRGGVRTLVIRSTIRLNNSTQIPLHVQLLSALPKRDILWDAVIPAGAEMSVPANYCSISNGRFFLQPLVEFAPSYSRGKRLSSVDLNSSALVPTEILVPEIPGQHNSSQESDQSLEEESDLISQSQNIEEFLKNPGNNSLRWRRKLLQKRGTVDSLSYNHWLIFNKQADSRASVNGESPARISCNVEVLSQGAPRSNKTRNADSFMLRTLTFTPSVSIVNLLRSDVEVALFNGLETASLINPINNSYAFPLGTNVVSLRPGESYGCVAFHSLEKVNLSIRISNVSKDSLWSNIVVVPSCSKDQGEDTTFTADLKFPNGSVLTVLLDVVDRKGHRIINLYVPYWIVSSSFITLQYQHDARQATEKKSKVVNGLDSLAADQLFDEKRNPKDGNTLNFRKVPLRGIGKSRGVGGIVLGPELPIRGLADILVNNRPSEFGKLITRKHDEFSLFSNGDGALETFTSGVDLPSHYHLIQCSYTNFDRRSGRLRLRGNGTNWSNFFSLDATTSTSVDIETSRKYADPDDNTGSSGRIPNRSGAQVFCFGIFTTTADPPFQRTRVTVVVDRYILLNSMGQSLEARQFGNEDVTTVHPNDQCPFWWRPGSQLIQIRLARYGWAWSGRFSVKREGEIPLRLRNEHDNTVFFVLVHVLKQGPRICIVFKGGDSVAPYRIENHTLETFKLRQVSTKGWRQDQNLQPKQTSLLPYHTCAYAWDEPLAPQEIVLELLKNGQSRSEMVGTFSFNRIETFPVKNNLIIRLIAQGPTRVLCIHDHRTSLNPGITSKTEPAFRKSDLFKLYMNIDSIGISIIDQTPQELIYVSITDLFVEHIKSVGEDSLKTEVGRVQVDSQILNTPFPSMIYPLKHEEDEKESQKKQASGLLPTLTSQLYVMSQNTRKPVFLSFEVIRNFTYPGVMFVPTFRVKVSPFDVNIEGVVISRLYSMISNFLNENVDFSDEISRFQFSRHNQMSRSSITIKNDFAIGRKDGLDELGMMLTTTNRHFNSPPVEDLGVETVANVIARKILELSAPPLRLTQPSPKIYLQHMELSDLRLNVSFSAEGINPVINSIVASGDSLMSNALSTVIIAVFSTALKIDNCPLRFSTYSLDHAFLSVDDLGVKLGFDYAMQAAGQAHLILGSSELLGNVVQLLQLLKEGLWDFMYLPAVGLMTSPQAFGSGVVKGFSSLLRFTAVSLCSTIGHFASSLQIGLVTLGVIDSDTTFQEERGGPTSFILQNRPKGSIDGMKQGFNDLMQFPLIGFRNDGLRGVITGTFKGSLRLLAKPLYGLLGTAYQATDRISFRLLPRVKKDQKHRLKRSRPPRFFHSPHLPLQVYSADENMGQELLSRVNMGAFKSEGYVCHYRLREGTILIVTTIRVMVVGDSFDFCELHWACALSQFLFLEIDYDRNMLLIPDLSFIENQSKSSQGSDSELGDFINVLSSPRRAASLDTTSNMSLQTMNVSDDGKHRNLNKRLKSLKGQPTLQIYFLPDVETFSKRATYRQGKESSRCSGFKLRHQTIGLSSHEQLIDLLRHLIKKAAYLATDDVEAYIKDCGLKVIHGPLEEGGVTASVSAVSFQSHGSNLSSQGNQSSPSIFPPSSPKSKRGLGPSTNTNTASQLFLLPIQRSKGPSSSIFMYRECSKASPTINSTHKNEKLPSVYEGDDPLERSFVEDAVGDNSVETASRRWDSTEEIEEYDFDGESVLGPT